MNDREFVSTTGTRHRLAQQARLALYEESARRSPERWWAGCGQVVDLSNPVVQQRVKDCKRCYPKGRVES